MRQKGIVTARRLRLRDSPRDGKVLALMEEDTEIEILGRETWLRVKHGDEIGFALADYVEIAQLSVEPQALSGIIDYPPSDVLKGQQLRIDADFAPAVKRIEERAKKDEISIWITSSFREPNKPVSRSIVDPAKFSNHHVGHAFDMNLIYKGEFLNSKHLADSDELPEVVKEFLNDIDDKLKLRWGGKFAPKDPVHVDDKLNRSDKTEYARKFAALWGDGSASNNA